MKLFNHVKEANYPIGEFIAKGCMCAKCGYILLNLDTDAARLNGDINPIWLRNCPRCESASSVETSIFIWDVTYEYLSWVNDIVDSKGHRVLITEFCKLVNDCKLHLTRAAGICSFKKPTLTRLEDFKHGTREAQKGQTSGKSKRRKVHKKDKEDKPGSTGQTSSKT